MNSLRLVFFLFVSLAGHAAVLIPASNVLVALFDGEEMDANEVVVSVSVISKPGNPDHTTVRSGSLYHGFSEQAPLIHPPVTVPPQPVTDTSSPEVMSEKVAKGISTTADPNLAPKVKEYEPRTEIAKAEQSRDATDEDPEAANARDRVTPQQPESVSISASHSNQSVARHLRLEAEGKYLAELLDEISRYRIYPSGARKRGHQGSVEVELVIRKNGTFESVEISSPSNHGMLNRASARAVRKLKRFKPFPAEIDREAWHISIPFRYVLKSKTGDNS